MSLFYRHSKDRDIFSFIFWRFHLSYRMYWHDNSDLQTILPSFSHSFYRSSYTAVTKTKNILCIQTPEFLYPARQRSLFSSVDTNRISNVHSPYSTCFKNKNGKTITGNSPTKLLPAKNLDNNSAASHTSLKLIYTCRLFWQKYTFFLLCISAVCSFGISYMLQNRKAAWELPMLQTLLFTESLPLHSLHRWLPVPKHHH